MNKIVLDIKGTNINGEDAIVGWISEDEARDTYSQTPGHAEFVNDPRVTGRQIHLKDGLWLTRCHEPECDAYLLSWGTLPGYAYKVGMGTHEIEAHGAKIPGINVGLMA